MSINMYGNINGSSYHAPNIDLFEMAKKQNNHLLKFSDTEQGQNIPDIKVNISKEGLQALHGSKLTGSSDLQATVKSIQFMSEHQPIESFTKRFSFMMPSDYEKGENGEYIFVRKSVQEKADSILKGFKSLYDEVASGYTDGTRVRFVEDKSSEDGFRKLSKDEELQILQNEMESYVKNKFGEESQKQYDLAAKVVNDMQKLKRKIGKGDIMHYEPVQIPKDLIERTLKSAKDFVDAYNS